MKIIADCGATKSQWRVLYDDGSVKELTAGGINASTMSATAIAEIISEISDKISAADNPAAEIYLYMAGPASDELQSAILSIFSSTLRVSCLEIHSDLLAAARAGCGHAPGIAAILGTGSNSCEYDGRNIVSKVSSGGFILGDEGSAATLGKLFLSDFIKGLIPEEIATDFVSRFTSDYAGIVANVYGRESSPSGYLGSLAPFIMEHYGHPYIKNLVEGNFRSFIRRSIKQYDTGRLAVSVIGSFGYALQEIFTRIASEEGITVSRFIKAPIDALVEFHIQDAG